MRLFDRGGFRGESSTRLLTVGLVVLSVLLRAGGTTVAVNHSTCALVQNEIQQELTLDRQTFVAHMCINDGLTNIILEDVAVDISSSNDSGNTIHANFDRNDTEGVFLQITDELRSARRL